jgi:CubicO group peptidase (beta-lactamase class C family)
MNMAEFRTDELNTRAKVWPKRKLKRSIKRFLLLFISAATITFITNIIHHSLQAPKSAKTNNFVHRILKKDPPLEKGVVPKVVDVNNDQAIDRYLKGLNFNGTALVVKDNKVVLNKGYGYADFENKLANNSETVFYIGSITKVFISTAIMQLQEQGKLNINDFLSQYIPDFPNGKQIKLYHLLTHTSGIPEHSETIEKISHDDLIKKIEKGKLKFQPGTNWYYSDSNYTILAYIVEKITKEPLESYVKGHIFTKAGMKHTGFGDAYYNQTFPSKGYKQKENEMISPALPDMSELFGCGDIYTTPYDMYLFDKALYAGKFLTQESLKQFFTPFKHNYALGLYRDPGSYSDHGVLPGWNTLNSFSRNGNEFVVLLSNVQNGVKSLGEVNNQLYGMLRNKN